MSNNAKYRLAEFEIQPLSEGCYSLKDKNKDIIDRLITLNKSAAQIWQYLQNREFDVDTIEKFLVNEYGIDHDMALSDAKDLIETWEDASLIISLTN